MNQGVSAGPAADDLLVRTQLGRTPRTHFSIATRCPIGHPQVIRCYPLIRHQNKIEPFPTLYWLTCPRLVRQISRLEAQGWISRLEQRLADSTQYLEHAHHDHAHYIAERWALLTTKDQSAIESARLTELYHQCGVAGGRDRSHLKCLHAHYAFHLVRPTLVGSLMDAAFSLETCTK